MALFGSLWYFLIIWIGFDSAFGFQIHFTLTGLSLSNQNSGCSNFQPIYVESNKNKVINSLEGLSYRQFEDSALFLDDPPYVDYHLFLYLQSVAPSQSL